MYNTLAAVTNADHQQLSRYPIHFCSRHCSPPPCHRRQSVSQSLLFTSLSHVLVLEFQIINVPLCHCTVPAYIPATLIIDEIDSTVGRAHTVSSSVRKFKDASVQLSHKFAQQLDTVPSRLLTCISFTPRMQRANVQRSPSEGYSGRSGNGTCTWDHFLSLLLTNGRTGECVSASQCANEQLEYCFLLQHPNQTLSGPAP